MNTEKRPKIRITLIDRKGERGCHRGHKIGDSFDFDTERGKLWCIMLRSPILISCVMAEAFPDKKKGQRFFAAPMLIR